MKQVSIHIKIENNVIPLYMHHICNINDCGVVSEVDRTIRYTGFLISLSLVMYQVSKLPVQYIIPLSYTIHEAKFFLMAESESKLRQCRTCHMMME